MKQAVRLLGILAAVVAGFFFLRQAAAALTASSLVTLFSWRTVWGAAAMLALYMVQVPLAALVWRLLLVDMDVKVSPRASYAIIALTQFGKYLPGNVAHHVGRVVVARRFAGDLTRLSLSLVYENMIALLAGVHVTALFLIWRPAPALEQWLPSAWRPWLLVAVTLGAILAFLLLPDLVHWWQRRRQASSSNQPSVRISFPHALRCYALFVISFLTLGLGFTLLTYFVSSSGGFPFLALCGAFAAAWVIGLLVPGAPAGLGIREAVLLVLLTGVVNESDAFASIALLRVVTTAGDLLQFACGGWLMRGISADSATM